MRKSIRSFLLAFAVLAGMAGVAAAPALADGFHHDRDVRAYAWHDRWAPPAVVVAPAPVPVYGVYAYPAPPPAPVTVTASLPFLHVTIR